MLKLENIHTYYGAIQALNGVSVDVNKGEIVTDRRQRRRQDHAAHDRLRQSQGQGRQDHVRGRGHHPQGHAPHHAQRHRHFSGRAARVQDLTVAENLMMGGFFAKRDEIHEGIDHVYGLFPG